MRFSPKQLVGAAAVAVLLAVGGGALRSHDAAQLNVALDNARTARLALTAEATHAARADSVAASAQARAAEVSAREAGFVAQAGTAARTLAALRSRYALAPVPDTCRSLKAVADSTLAVSDSVAASERAARLAADERAAALQVGLDTTRAALTSLRGAAVVATRAAAALEHAAKPSLFARFLKAAAPRIGVGVGAGLDVHGAPNAVTGITLGWSF